MSKPFALLALAACSTPIATAEDWARPVSHTPYSCDGVTAARQAATVDPELIRPWHELATAKKRDGIWVGEVNLLTYRWSARDLTVEARVRIQHEMLEVAHALDRMRRANAAERPWYDETHRRVMDLVQAMAPTAAQLEELGDGTRPAVHAVLGPTLGITERATETCGSGRSIHVAKHHGLLAFRPLRADHTRALVAQIVAFDSDGKPHVTPLVSGMELRLGHELSSPACVVEAQLDGTLAVETHDSFEELPPFVKRRDAGVGCKTCHYSANAMNARDLTSAEAATVDIARMRQVDQLANELWKTLREPLHTTGAR